jgi:hypothetical protein
MKTRRTNPSHLRSCTRNNPFPRPTLQLCLCFEQYRKFNTPMPKGLPGRLSKGAGTHLASWLQEVTALSEHEGQALLDSRESRADSTTKGQRALAGLLETHGKKAGHSKPITDIAYSGDIIITKDIASMRLWRARGDFALLRVLTCRGKHVAVHRNGQYIVTGERRTPDTGLKVDKISKTKPKRPVCKVWGPAGGSAVGAGKTKITHSVA